MLQIGKKSINLGKKLSNVHLDGSKTRFEIRFLIIFLLHKTQHAKLVNDELVI